jgi:16S rRNA (cytosine967-C5)-methyltransferase
VAPARTAAYAVLLREAHGRGRFDLTVDAAPDFDRLDARDRSLAFELVTGTLKRRNSLDRVIAAFSSATHARTPVAVRESLRLGTYQLLYLGRVPAHAVVSDSVELVKPRGQRTAAYVNAVLRHVATEGRATLARLSERETSEALAVRYSHPDWLVALWLDELGRPSADELMQADNRPAERCVRVNGLRATPAQAQASLAADGITATQPQSWSETPEALLVEGPAVQSSTAFRDGLITPQSRASQLVARLAAAGRPGGGRFADLCAAPGLKTSHLVALLPGWRATAVDDDAARVEELRHNLARLGAANVDVVERDVLEFGGDPAERGAYDVVLLDAPCSGLGTLASRADLRWRRRAGDIARLAALQQRLLAAAARLVAPGGTLTYSVCTLTRAETTDVVEQFLGASTQRAGDAWVLDDLGADYPRYRHAANGACLQTLPSRDATTGFFVARVRRVE